MRAWRRNEGMRDGAARRVSRKEDIRSRIRLKILTGAIAPGSPIDEEALAEEFGVSRTPIREICAHLVAEGSADHQRGRGACAPSVTPDGIDAFFEAAGTAYPALFSLIVSRIDAFDLAHLRGLVQAAIAVTEHGPLEMRAARYLDVMEGAAQMARNSFLARGNSQLMREECRIAVSVSRLRGGEHPLPDPLDLLVSSCSQVVAMLERRDLDGLLNVLESRLRRSRSLHDRLIRLGPLGGS
ncbi:MAG: GntR family transcriptional regulator [Pseudomonadota bacterium]